MNDAEQSAAGGSSLMDLFRQETQAQTAALTEGLLALERSPGDTARLAALMRAAHSLKGAARIVGLEAAVTVAHALEDCFVAAQQGALRLDAGAADVLLRGVDLLGQVANAPDAETWRRERQDGLAALLAQLAALRAAPPPAPAAALPTARPVVPAPAPAPAIPPADAAPAAAPDARFVRVTSANLTRMLDLMGEVSVQTRWMAPFAAELQALRRSLNDIGRRLERACGARLAAGPSDAAADRLAAEMRRRLDACRAAAAHTHERFELWSQQFGDLADRLYREGLRSRMRPFADGVQGFPRMVRDLARRLGKEAAFEVSGQATGVDRDILDRLEAPLAHLLRNALDHGLETPAERQAAGKPAAGRLTLAARHHAGQLLITVADDGRGIDSAAVRRKAVARGLCAETMAARLSEAETLEFLFLPGFSTSDAVSEISGRGVGLDIVRALAQEVGGQVRIETRPGAGTRVHLQLPITLSVLRALLVEIAGHPYAIPLGRVERLATALPEAVQTLEGRRFLALEGRSIGLADARAVLGLEGAAAAAPPGGAWPVVAIGDRAAAYGLVVGRFLGEQDLVVRPLDARLGKVQDVAALALLEDGSPTLILDVDDLLRSIEALLAGGRLRAAQAGDAGAGRGRRKRVLVADDSITVRELERQILEHRGYAVDTAVDGMDAWNVLRAGRYDLVVSDVDMPRLNGIDLVRQIKQDARLRSVPVVIVSYKDREEDRLRGLEAGAEHYLAKSSFHDASFLKAVADLIGDP